MSVKAYCRHIKELVHGVKQLSAEGRERLGDRVSNPEEREKRVAVWAVLQAEKVAADARARVGEREIEDGYWSREEPDSPTH